MFVNYKCTNIVFKIESSKLRITHLIKNGIIDTKYLKHFTAFSKLFDEVITGTFSKVTSSKSLCPTYGVSTYGFKTPRYVEGPGSVKGWYNGLKEG